ncbi:ECA polysaccharide chain length modulation protein [Xenorhabdus nematophila]|uniref:ECA polysaccharide chain length modulation protein n=1 Tax=Xenorhabdus nematophila TaxID=628 RepID=UPI000541AB67|nr:ECA polysaccharide chain length modulation protein [Xenorhabdus nematophila]CEE90134.1 modulator of enterobacterial common antigen (ECA) polysaccharide chain length [Xenorhabdus nematophila str. Anatoliense]CEF31642.1 modulator of enterobacterial common antigen (ECA) polysaccharide chain length [Xenorhabdus nematophila str. Websteri]AYA41405.1 ECA polysaccharide chain length modulation protein [Xenorhabdus nematophila]MBA0020143.1 ECA polysaccharide chain length modulation protein [Xenorhabd
MINSETKSKQDQPAIEYELDVRTLCRALWKGKIWIIALAMIFAAVALGASYLMQQKWSATAIVDLPTTNNLGSYYSQQQFLRNLDTHINASPEAQLPTIPDGAYKEFMTQVAAYDTRREFWLHSDYYKQRREGAAKADAVLLDELINDIKVTRGDDKNAPNDSIKLTAETATDSNQLLRKYIAFANQRASEHLNNEIKGAWATRTQSMKALVKRQEMVAKAMYTRELNVLQQSSNVAEKQGIHRNQTDIPIEELPESKMFMLGTSLLQAQIETLEATGPDYSIDYDQNIAMLATLNVGPTLQDTFQTYRYLRTPEEPVGRDSPRRIFMMVMWGAVGMLMGAGLALVRRHRYSNPEQ